MNKNNQAAQERADFSQRLQQALNQNGYPPDSPTALAREFNLRFSGGPVTVHAARKWLVGESVPTQEKVRTLASWLDVPIEWLRFGSAAGKPEMPSSSNANFKLRPKHMPIMQSLHNLTDDQCELVHKVILNMVKAR
jgi:hypothetical protein